MNRGVFMRKEIFEGPHAVERTISECTREAEEIAGLIKEMKVNQGFIIGSGTSFHASLHLQYLLTRYTELGFTAIPASEFNVWRPSKLSKYAIIGFSQSGESTDIVEAFKSSSENVLRFCVTNTPGSTLTRLSHKSLVTRAGEEKAVTATKTYDTQLTASYLITFSVAQSEGIDELWNELKGVPKQLEEVLKTEKKVKEVASKYKDVKDIFVLGHSINLATAYEASLKLKEAAMVHSEGFAVREFLHGPIQLVDERSLVMLLVPDNGSYEYSKSVINKTISYKAPVLAILNKEIKPEVEMDTIEVPPISSLFSPLTLVKVIQLFALHLSLEKGLNPDKPTKLTKVVKESFK